MASVNYGKHILASVIMTNVVMVSVNYGKHILASVIMTNVFEGEKVVNLKGEEGEKCINGFELKNFINWVSHGLRETLKPTSIIKKN